MASERRPRHRTSSARPGIPRVRPDHPGPASAVRCAHASRALGGVADGRRIPGDGRPRVPIPGRDRNRPAPDDDDDDDDDDTTTTTTTTMRSNDSTMRFNPSPRHPTGDGQPRRRSTGPRSPGSGGLGASSASRLASRRAANRRAAAVGSEGRARRRLIAANLGESASPRPGDDVLGNAGFAPAVRLFLPGRRRRVRGTSPSGLRRDGARRLAAVFAEPLLAESFPARLFLPNPFSPRRRRRRERSLRTRLSRPTSRAERLSRPEPSRWARPRRRRPIDGGSPRVRAAGKKTVG